MKYFFFLSLLLVLSACDSGKSIKVIFQEDQNIRKGMPVVIHNMKVGKVSDVELNKKFEVVATLLIEEKYNIPEDSRFELRLRNIFEQVIEIVPGKSSKNLKPGSWVHGHQSDGNPLDSLLNNFTEAMKDAGKREAADEVESGTDSNYVKDYDLSKGKGGN